MPDSRFELQTGQLDTAVPFHGAIFADPKTFEFLRLEITAEEIPVRLGLKRAEVQLEYGKVQFGADSFLLRIRGVTRTLSEKYVDRNRITFSKCHRFSGESSLRFDEPDVSIAAATLVNEEVVLKPDAELQLGLTGNLDLANGAVGEPVEAKLSSDVKFGTRSVPKGSTATRTNRAAGSL